MIEPSGSESGSSVLRMLAMLRALPRQPNQILVSKLSELLIDQGFKVSTRTVQRDLQLLSTHFPISTDGQRGKSGAVWFWMENGAPLNLPGMDASTALALLVAKDHLSASLPLATLESLRHYFSEAESTLNRLPARALNSWRRKIRVLNHGPQLDVPAINKDVQRAVDTALLRDQKLSIEYRSRGATANKEQVLNPIALVVRDCVHYLVATTWNYTKPVHYALHRVHSATVLDEPSVAPVGFDLDRYIKEQQAFGYPEGETAISLCLLVTNSLATHLAERPLGKDQIMNLERDKRTRVMVTVADTAELRWWLLALGEQVEVIEPKRIRVEMTRTIAAMATRYSDRSGKRSDQ